MNNDNKKSNLLTRWKNRHKYNYERNSGSRISCLTYNIKQRCYWSNKKNIMNIIEFIKQGKYDTICLQEVFGDETIRLFKKHLLKDNKFHHIDKILGLMIFTKFEISDVKVMMFESTSIISHKGAVRIEIKLNKNKSIYVINANLEHNVETALKQLISLNDLVVKDETIVFGDLHLNYLNGDFARSIFENKSIYDTTARNYDSTVRRSQKIIDYGLILTKHVLPIDLKIHNQILFSDNLPLEINFVIN